MENMDNTKEQFLCYWGRGYIPNYEVKDAEYFSERNGYTQEDIEQISNMEVDEIVNLSDTDTHIIIRML